MSGLRLLMTTDAVGGVWQYSVDLARGLASSGVLTVLVVVGPAPVSEQRAEAAAVPGLKLVETGLALDWMASNQAQVTAAATRISALAVNVAPDVIQLNTPALAAGKRFVAPVVAMAHSCVSGWWDATKGERLPAQDGWRATMMRDGLRAADVVVAPSVALADALRRTHRLRARPVVVHNGRVLAPVAPRPMRDVVFTAGRLWDQSKNVRLLDRVARRSSVPFDAAGPVRGPHGETVPLENLRALGVLSEQGVAECLSERPIFVSATRYEPFGLAVLEAAGAGCALVLSDIATFRELWEDAAIFVSSDDEDGFVRSIDELLADPSRRLTLGAAAHARAANYTPAAMSARMLAIYRDLTRAAVAA